MTSSKKPQMMKPATAAKKLGVYLPATPAQFQEDEISREDLAKLQAEPPEWLETLLREGPHPRGVVAGKLGVSIAGLARSDMADTPLTTAEIKALLQAPPAWLVEERATQAKVREEQVKVKERDAARRERAAKR